MGKQLRKLLKKAKTEEASVQKAARKRGLWSSLGSILLGGVAMAVTGGAAPFVAAALTGGGAWAGGHLGNWLAGTTKEGKLKGGRFFQNQRSDIATEIKQGIDVKALKAAFQAGFLKLFPKISKGGGFKFGDIFESGEKALDPVTGAPQTGFKGLIDYEGSTLGEFFAKRGLKKAASPPVTGSGLSEKWWKNFLKGRGDLPGRKTTSSGRDISPRPTGKEWATLKEVERVGGSYRGGDFVRFQDVLDYAKGNISSREFRKLAKGKKIGGGNISNLFSSKQMEELGFVKIFDRDPGQQEWLYRPKKFLGIKEGGLVGLGALGLLTFLTQAGEQSPSRTEDAGGEELGVERQSAYDKYNQMIEGPAGDATYISDKLPVSESIDPTGLRGSKTLYDEYGSITGSRPWSPKDVALQRGKEFYETDVGKLVTEGPPHWGSETPAVEGLSESPVGAGLTQYQERLFDPALQGPDLSLGFQPGNYDLLDESRARAQGLQRGLGLQEGLGDGSQWWKRKFGR